MLPAGGEHGDQCVLFGRSLSAAAVPGSLSVDERSAAVSQPLSAGEAQVSVNSWTLPTMQWVQGSAAGHSCEVAVLWHQRLANGDLMCNNVFMDSINK